MGCVVKLRALKSRQGDEVPCTLRDDLRLKRRERWTEVSQGRVALRCWDWREEWKASRREDRATDESRLICECRLTCGVDVLVTVPASFPLRPMEEVNMRVRFFTVWG